MKNLEDYQNLKTELETIKLNHNEAMLDPCWICVSARNMTWREAKKLGMKKDYSNGWVFYKTSANGNGYDLYQKIDIACQGFNLFVEERQL